MLLKTIIKSKATHLLHHPLRLLHHLLQVVQARLRQTAHRRQAPQAAAQIAHLLLTILQARLMTRAQAVLAANKTRRKTTSNQDNRDANRSKMKRRSNVKLKRPRATNLLKLVPVVASLSTNKSNC